MKHLTFSVFTSVCFSLISVSPCWSQTDFRHDPALPNPNNVNSAPANSSYTIDNNITCPSATFSISAFGADAFNRTKLLPDQTNFGGSGNYGASVGVSIPIGGSLDEFCRDLAILRTDYERNRVQAQQLKTYAEIAVACAQLAKFFPGMSADDPSELSEFYDDPNNASLIPCRNVIAQILEGKRQRQSSRGSASELNEIAEKAINEAQDVTEVKTWQQEPMRIQITNPEGLFR